VRFEAWWMPIVVAFELEFQTVLELALLTIFPGAVAFAASMDLLTMTIPNRISLALVATFFALAPFAGLGAEAIAFHVLAGLLVLGIGVILFQRGVFGGGDAKLLAAVALWVGFEHLLAYTMMVAISGGVLAIVIVFARAAPLPHFLLGQTWAHRLHSGTTGIPYGIALAAGALWVYPTTQWCIGLVG
jgi:prepilin peptidase CpaA